MAESGVSYSINDVANTKVVEGSAGSDVRLRFGYDDPIGRRGLVIFVQVIDVPSGQELYWWGMNTHPLKGRGSGAADWSTNLVMPFRSTVWELRMAVGDSWRTAKGDDLPRFMLQEQVEIRVLAEHNSQGLVYGATEADFVTVQGAADRLGYDYLPVSGSPDDVLVARGGVSASQNFVALSAEKLNGVMERIVMPLKTQYLSVVSVGGQFVNPLYEYARRAGLVPMISEENARVYVRDVPLFGLKVSFVAGWSVDDTKEMVDRIVQDLSGEVFPGDGGVVPILPKKKVSGIPGVSTATLIAGGALVAVGLYALRKKFGGKK